MKQKSLSAIIFFAVLFVLLSCKKEENVLISSPDSKIPNYESTLDYGFIHNQVMDHVLQSLGTVKDSVHTSPYLIRSIAFHTFEESICNQLNLEPEVVISFLNRFGIYNGFEFSQTEYNALRNRIDNCVDSLKYLDPNFEQFTSEILNSVDNSNNLTEFSNNANESLQVFIGTEYEELAYTIVSIATSSFEYWHNRSAEWSDLYPNNPAGKVDPRAKSIIKEDIKGAISGAVGGAFGGFAVFGLGAIPGAIFGACVTASHSSALEGIFVAFGWN